MKPESVRRYFLRVPCGPGEALAHQHPRVDPTREFGGIQPGTDILELGDDLELAGRIKFGLFGPGKQVLHRNDW